MRKPLTPEQRDRKNALARERRRKRAKAKIEAGILPKPAYDYDRIASVIYELVNQQLTVTKAEVRYRVDSHKHNGKKIGMKVIERICDDLVALGKIAKVTDGKFVKYKKASAGELDKLFGMVKHDGPEVPVRFFSMESLHERVGSLTPRVVRGTYGIRSTFGDAYGWDAAW